MSGLAAGRLRHRVTVQHQVQSTDALTGDVTLTWENLFENIAAEVLELSVREFIAAQSSQSQVSAKITVRYRPGLDASQRILFRDKIYNPAGVLPDQNSGLEFITIPCSQGPSQG